jgi:hypothetical protein
MHFQVIKDDYYNGILTRIKECIPDFTSVFDEEDGVYPILGELGTFIVESIKNEKVVEEAIYFMNEAIEHGGSETEDVIVLQLFQKIYENADVTCKIQKKLSEKTKIIFDKYLREYGNEIMDK